MNTEPLIASVIAAGKELIGDVYQARNHFLTNGESLDPGLDTELLDFHDVLVVSVAAIEQALSSPGQDAPTYDLAHRIENVMNSQGITTSALAEAAGVSPGTITGILDGTTLSPRATTLNKLEEALGLGTGYLNA